MADWEERGFWGRLFQKELPFTTSKIQKIQQIGWNGSKKGHLGVSGPSSGSKLRCECNGMPPGGQNGKKNSKIQKNPEKSRKSRISIFSYRSPIGALYAVWGHRWGHLSPVCGSFGPSGASEQCPPLFWNHERPLFGSLFEVPLNKD